LRICNAPFLWWLAAEDLVEEVAADLLGVLAESGKTLSAALADDHLVVLL
jgi:hypothetical protein